MKLITKAQWNRLYDIIGAAMEVYNTIGRSLPEAFYQKAMEIELTYRNIPFVAQYPIVAYYKGQALNDPFKADIYSDDVIIELKSTPMIIPEFRAQLFNYLRITNKNFGALINFGEGNLHTERYVWDDVLDEFVYLDRDNHKNYIESYKL